MGGATAMRDLHRRLSSLEAQRKVGPSKTDRNAAADRVMSRLERLGSHFTEEDRTMPLSLRLNMSPAEHCAWALKFQPQPVAAIRKLHSLEQSRHA